MIDDFSEMLYPVAELHLIRRGSRLIEHLTDVDDPHRKRSYLHDTNLSGAFRMSSISNGEARKLFILTDNLTRIRSVLGMHVAARQRQEETRSSFYQGGIG